MALISFWRRFAFIKTTKTAGTSLEVHLSKWMGPNDIVTPIFPENENHLPRNHAHEGGQLFFNHMTADEMREALGERFDSLFRFCFERHPVEKCLSYFAMLRNSPSHRSPYNPKTWEDYLAAGVFPIDADKYTDSAGDCIVDRIYRYEEIDEALQDIELRTGIPASPLLAREKAGYRYGVPTFNEVMANPAQRNKIMSAFETSLRFVPY